MAANKRLVRALLTVFAIASVFLVVIFFVRGSALVNYKDEAERRQLLAIKFFLIKFRKDHGRYPSEAEGLRSLVNPSPSSEYLPDDFFLFDPWLHEVVYRPNKPPEKEGFLIYSLGQNGVDNGGKGDDIAVRY